MEAMTTSPSLEAESDLKTRLATPELRRLIERIVRKRVPAMDVEDVVQTVLCDALAADSAPADAEQLRKWIVGITRHKIADFFRQGSREKVVELPTELAAEPPPIEAREWAQWAEQQTESSPDEQRTLGWMAREGGGEKLAHIATEESLPPDQVRQRVSRLRRLMKRRWLAELAAVAAVAALILLAWQLLKEPEPIAEPSPDPAPSISPDVQRARELRAEAFGLCERARWQQCLDRLEDAKRLDAAGDSSPAVRQARQQATEALRQQEQQRNEKDGEDDGPSQNQKDDSTPVAPERSSPPAPPSAITPPAPYPPKSTKPGPDPNQSSKLDSDPTSPSDWLQPQKPTPPPPPPTTSSPPQQPPPTTSPPPQQPPPPTPQSPYQGQTKGGKGGKGFYQLDKK